MNRNETAVRVPPTTKMKSRGAFVSSFVFTFGIVIAAVSVLTTRRTSYLLYYLNWHHWPWWYAVNLWIIAAGAILNCFIERHKARRILSVVSFFAVTCVTLVYSDWLHPVSNRVFCYFKTFYFTIVRPNLYTPLTEFFSGGGVSSKLFFIPATAAAVGSVFLVFLMRSIILRKNDKSVPEQEGSKHE